MTQDMTRTEPQSDLFQCAETLRHRHVAVMFADLDHFTRICIDDPPEFVFGLIRDFQRVVTSAVAEFRGKLNSYQGDGILATFADLAGRGVAGDVGGPGRAKAQAQGRATDQGPLEECATINVRGSHQAELPCRLRRDEGRRIAV